MANKIPKDHELLSLPIPAALKTALKAEAALAGKTLADLVTEKLSAAALLVSVDGHYMIAAPRHLCEVCGEKIQPQLKKEA